MSQKSELLAALRLGSVCSYVFYQQGNRMTHRLAARILDLKHDGYEITSRPCQNVEHGHVSRAVIYELAGMDQLSLL
jgi:hypothetical protein